MEVELFQSNEEGEIVGFLQGAEGASGLIINAGAPHPLRAVAAGRPRGRPFAYSRGAYLKTSTRGRSFRRHSVIAPIAVGQIAGLGTQGYELALEFLSNRLKPRTCRMNVNSRLERLRNKLDEEDLDAILISSPENRRYLSGFTGSAGYLLVSQDDAALATDFRYVEQAGRQAPDFRVERISARSGWLLKLVEEQGGRRVGFESEHVTVAAHAALEKALSEGGEARELIAVLRRGRPAEADQRRRRDRSPDAGGGDRRRGVREGRPPDRGGGDRGGGRLGAGEGDAGARRRGHRLRHHSRRRPPTGPCRTTGPARRSYGRARPSS